MDYELLLKVLKPGDVILWRDKLSPISLKTNGQVYGNWDGAHLYLRDGWILVGPVIMLNKLQSIYDESETTFAIFRAKSLSFEQVNRIHEIAYSLTGLNLIPSKEQRLKYWFRKRFAKYNKACVDHLLYTTTVCTSTDIIASAYEAAGIPLSKKHPWKMTPIDLDASDVLVRVM